MYRVKDNGNGSFDVLDSCSGNLVMVINNNKENGRLKRVTTTFSTTNLVQSKKSNQLLTPINCYRRRDKLKQNGLSPSVSLPIVKLCEPVAKRNIKNKSITEFQRVNSPAMTLKRRRAMKDFDDMEEDDHYDCVDQESFMNFFGLSSTAEPNQSVIRLQKFNERLTVVTPTYTRNNVFDVDLCSNLGQAMVDNSQAVYAVTETPSSTVAKYEKYCQASSRRLGNWDVPFRQPNVNYAVTYSPKIDWTRTHLYSFNRKQRLQRYRRIKTGLTKRSRSLLRLCTNVTIALKRVTNDEITSKCLLPLESIVESTIPITSSVNNSSFGSRSPSMSVSEYPCIDGTIVIEIDELGSETVRVSQKPSKMINQQTGNPWLSPHSLSTSGSRLQSALRAKKCLLMSDDVKKLPSSSAKVSTIRTNGDYSSDSDSDIEIIGMYSTEDTSKLKKKPLPVLRNLLIGLSDNNKDLQSSADSISINPLEFVATDYDNSFRGKNIATCSTLINEQRHSVTRSPNKSCTDRKLSITRRAGRVNESAQPRLQTSLELENGHDVIEVNRSNAKRPNTQQIDLDMISRLVFLGRSDSAITRRASARNSEVSCVFKCHVCKCEELFKKDAVDSVYCHMVKHGGLSCTSLVSNLEEFQGYEVAILQAFPITE